MEEINNLKICNRCKIAKDFLKYSKDRQTSDGFANRCKDCQKEIRDAKKGKVSTKQIRSSEDASKWLKENNFKYKIKKWGGSASSKSIFLDIKRNVEFEYTFSRFRDKIQKNPDKIFFPTNSELQNKIRKSFKEKYGVECALQVDKFKRKAQKTNLKKYGTTNPMKSSKFKKEKGIVKLIEGKTIKEWADNLGISYSHFRNVMAYEGLDVAKNLKKSKTNLESKVELILKDLNVNYIYNEWFSDIKIRPDFLLPENNLIIECNGFRWHSDEFIKNKNFHQKRLEKINKINYDGLFFYTDEILNKPHIVSSIISNKIKLNKKIYARKCKLKQLNKEASKEFFEENHLMGQGKGRTYASIFEDDIVAAIQVSWKNKDEKLLDISRFCTKNNVSVIGGYSRLIKHAIKEERPEKIQTFVDRRYGSGKYLASFGFQKSNEDISFCWTDGQKSFHRMKFPGNSGYEYGLFKIWDCGQAKYELTIN